MKCAGARKRDITPDDGPPRSEGVPRATGEGYRCTVSTVGQNATASSKPQRSAAVENSDSGKPHIYLLKNEYKVGTWNVRGMGLGKLDVIKREMERMDITVLGLSEMKWSGKGHFTSDTHTVYYSGQNRITGVGFIVNKELAKSVLGYNPVNDRIILLRIQGRPLNITIVQVYAPTSAAEEKEKEEFYHQLDQVLTTISSKDITMVMGDFNAKVGKGLEDGIVGPHGLGKRNEEGDRLVQFCISKKLLVSNTCYQQPNRRLYTWTSPDKQHRNQIDYILCQERWRNSLLNVKTLPGADCGTDHELLVAKMRVRLKVKKKGHVPIRYDLDNIPDAYAVNVKNRFKALEMEEKDPEQMWTEISGVMKEEANSNIPPRPKRHRTPWLKEETIVIAEKRRAAKAKGDAQAQKNYQAQFQKNARRDKRNYLEAECRKIEGKNQQGKTRDMFRKIMEVTGSFSPRMNVIKNAKGIELIEGEKIKEGWREYVEKLYKRDPTMGCVFAPPQFQPEPPILLEEVRQAIQQLANNKSPGIDDLPIELIKALGAEGENTMLGICQKIWDTLEWPQQWKQSVYIPIPKKGDLKLCTNYRTITLISHASKVLLKIIQKRLEPMMETLLPDVQAGFRKARGTRDHISNVRWIMETCREYKKDIYLHVLY